MGRVSKNWESSKNMSSLAYLICQKQQGSIFSMLSQDLFGAANLFSVKLGISNLRKLLEMQRREGRVTILCEQSSLELIENFTKIPQDFRINNERGMEMKREMKLLPAEWFSHLGQAISKLIPP